MVSYGHVIQFGKIGMDPLCILDSKYKMEDDSLLGSLHFGHMFQDKDLYIYF
jgi:hypothetical protein